MWTFQYAPISAAGTLNVGGANTTLVGVTVNKGASTSTLTLYDNTAGSGTKIATIDCSATGNFSYFVRCKTGLTAVMATANADVTIIYA